ncbi:MAG: histidine kinase [Rhodocyclaceae bacterium]|jgi:two-component system nitrate/nitrite sensor histidine kinase NarX|nr:GAF domain-containing protein [Rhodocyclaceae bacterium]MCO5096192.1 histidine kinase [Rhodocyclaceae bacterium]
MTQGSTTLQQAGAESLAGEGNRIQALRVLSEVTATLTSEYDLETLLDRFLGMMVRLSGASGGVVRVVTSDGRHLRLAASLGLPAELVENERLVDINCGICGAALRSEEIKQTRDMRHCVERSGQPYFGQCSSMVVVPLEHNGRLLGVYNLYMTEDRPIPEEVSLLFSTISEHLSMAVENTRLLRENLRMTLMSERQMMANEVHDSLAQTMAYMKMRIELLREALLQYESGKALKYSGDIQQALDEAYASLRELLTQFRNRMDPLGLEHALDELAAGYFDRTGVRLEFENRIPDLDLTVDQEVQVFHILQEALSNVARHSGAKDAKLTLDVVDGHYAFTVDDDGRGVFVMGAQPDLRHHFGISIMSERAQRLSGNIEISNRPQGGARLRLLVPIHTEKAA